MPILKYLYHIEAVTKEDKEKEMKTIELSCFFEKNEYFSNPKLTSKLFYEEDEIYKSEGTTINWIKNTTIQISHIK